MVDAAFVPEKIIYETSVTAAGGREGSARSDDGLLDVALSLPKELGGPGGPGTNPEQLFAAGYAACFTGAVKLVARLSKIALPEDMSVTARVGMGAIAQGYALTVALEVSLPGIDRETGLKILEGAHQRCPYSNATRGNIDVKLVLA